MRKFVLAGPIAAVALVYVTTLAVLPPGGLWIIDNGNKRIQVEALLASGFRDFALPWPGRALDPDFAYNPLPNAFSVVRDGELYSVFSPVFPVLSAPVFRALGDAGLCLLPLLATLALLACVGRTAQLAGLSPRVQALATLIAGFATPLWFYAVVFWEHAVAACLCAGSVTLAIAFLTRGSLRAVFGSGLVIALAAGLRDPMLLFACALGALVCFAAPRERMRASLLFGAGVASGLLPLALFQWLALGDPLGFHLTHGFAARPGEPAGLLSHLRARPAVLHHLFLASAGGPALSALLCAPFALLLLAQPRLPERAWRAVALAAAAWALLGAIVTAAGYATSESSIERLLRSNGLFAAAPLLALALVRRRDAPAAAAQVTGWLLRLVLAYALLYAALTPLRNTTGIHWGNRYLLELYGLLAVPCALGLHELWRSTRSPAAALLALLAAASVALQVFSIDLLRRKLVFGETLERTVRERPEAIVITDVWWLPQTLARAFYEKSIFFVSAPEPARDLLDRLAQRGHAEFLFVTSNRGRLPDPRAFVVDDPGLGFFSLRLEQHVLPGRGSAPGPGASPRP